MGCGQSMVTRTVAVKHRPLLGHYGWRTNAAERYL